MLKRKIEKKNKSRIRTKFRIRKKISGVESRPRLSVFKSSKHIYAQVIDDEKGSTVLFCSTTSKDFSLDGLKDNPKVSTKCIASAKKVGLILGKNCLSKNIDMLVFDRNGFKYTGRIKALADGIRESGVQV